MIPVTSVLVLIRTCVVVFALVSLVSVDRITSNDVDMEFAAQSAMHDLDVGVDSEVFSVEHPRQIWVSLSASYLPPRLAA